MPRIDPIDPARAEGKAATLLAGVQKSLGMTPNLMSTLAVSPTALEAYLGLMKALGGGRLGGRLGEQLSLAISNANGCGYCTSVHTALGRHLGVEADELARNQRGRSADPKVEAALQFALALVAERGWVSDRDLQRVREAGYGDGDIAEITARVALNTFSNYFNHVAETEVDFPLVDVVDVDQQLAA